MGFSTSLEWGRRFALWRIGRSGVAERFMHPPAPVSAGDPQRGKQLLAEPQSPWNDTSPDAQAHHFDWLADLSALGGRAAFATAQLWSHDWITRFGGGKGAGWALDCVAWRTLHMLHNHQTLLRKTDDDMRRAYFSALSLHGRFLALHGLSAPDVYGRVAALVAGLRACLALEGNSHYADTALRALLNVLPQITGDKGITQMRNPQALLQTLVLLDWARESLVSADMDVPSALLRVITQQLTPLRSLRHKTGSLARFHGGGRGNPGDLDQLLARYRPENPVTIIQESLGFTCIKSANTSLIIDTAPPPLGGYASTLGFELCAGLDAVVVNCGSDSETQAHSTLSITGLSSSRRILGETGFAYGGAKLRDMAIETQDDAHFISAAHDGWSTSHGVLHRRGLMLSADGTQLTGTDALDRIGATLDKEIAFSIRFHLHPNSRGVISANKRQIEITLGSGAKWLFRYDGAARLSLAPSIYLEPGTAAQQANMQMILSSEMTGEMAPIGWTLRKVQDRTQ